MNQSFRFHLSRSICYSASCSLSRMMISHWSVDVFRSEKDLFNSLQEFILQESTIFKNLLSSINVFRSDLFNRFIQLTSRIHYLQEFTIFKNLLSIIVNHVNIMTNSESFNSRSDFDLFENVEVIFEKNIDLFTADDKIIKKYVNYKFQI